MIKLGGLIDLKPITEFDMPKFTAISKDSGKISVFSTAASRDAAIKAGTHEKRKDDKDGDDKKDTPKVNIFNKDKKSEPKKDKAAKGGDSSAGLDNAYDAKDFKSIVSSLKGKIDDREYEEISDELEALDNMQQDMQDLEDDGEDTYNEKIEIDSAVEDLQGRIKQALSKGKEEPKSDTPKAGTSNYDSEYFADDEKSDSSAYDDDDDYDDDEEDIEGVRKTGERLDKVEKALNDTLKLDDKGFTTARSSGGGQGEYEGPIEIYDKNAIGDDGEPKEGAATLSIGSGEQNGNMSIALVDFDGNEIFKGSDYAITGDRELSAEESFKLGKFLMKLPSMQRFLKGEISKDEFKPVYDRIQKEFSTGTAVESKNESKSMRLTNILKEADVFTATSKETGTTSVFKSKAARDAAIEKGTHEKRKDDKDDAVKDPTDKPKVNIFNKDKAAKGDDSSAGQKDDSDNLSQPNSVKGTGQADPNVNKAVRKAAQKAGITPQKLGKEEYEKKMAQAAYEALTDANFHTEARWLVADLEGKPELREKPNYPSIDDKDYDKKIDAIRSKYASQYADNVDDDAYELGVKSANEAGWAGATAIEGLVFDLKMNGSHKLANTILKSFKDANSSRNEGRLKLGSLLPEGKHKKLERDLKNLAGVAKIDFSEALESLEEDGVLEAMDHLENLIDRIKDVHKQLKRKS